jgi:hypothetical protein
LSASMPPPGCHPPPTVQANWVSAEICVIIKPSEKARAVGGLHLQPLGPRRDAGIAMCRRRLNTTKAIIQTKGALSVRLLHSTAPFRRTIELSEAGGRSAFRVYGERLE